MLLAHSVKYHEARDWIRLQGQSTLTYQSLLNHGKSLEQHCEQFKKAQIKDRAELTTISVAFSIISSVHQDAVTKHTQPNKILQMWIQTSKEQLPCFQANSVITTAVLDILHPYARGLGTADTPG